MKSCAKWQNFGTGLSGLGVIHQSTKQDPCTKFVHRIQHVEQLISDGDACTRLKFLALVDVIAFNNICHILELLFMSLFMSFYDRIHCVLD